MRMVKGRFPKVVKTPPPAAPFMSSNGKGWAKSGMVEPVIGTCGDWVAWTPVENASITISIKMLITLFFISHFSFKLNRIKDDHLLNIHNYPGGALLDNFIKTPPLSMLPPSR